MKLADLRHVAVRAVRNLSVARYTFSAFIVAISLAILFKLNKALVILAAHISFAPLIPFIIFLSYKTGAYWMGERAQSEAAHARAYLTTGTKEVV